MPSLLSPDAQADPTAEDGERRSRWRDRLRLSSRIRDRSKSSDNHRSEERSGGRERTVTSPQQTAVLGTKSLSSNATATQHNARVARGHEPPSKAISDTIQPEADIIIRPHVDRTAQFYDLWSVAYQEAVANLGEKVREHVTNDKKIDELFAVLEEKNDKSARDSLFRRGSRKLRLPLENIKMALDLASPLTSFAPTVSTAVGVAKSVIAVAIGICGAEDSMNSDIVAMLEHIAIIDECDTLGQKLRAGNTVHNALVPVYQNLVKFYVAAFDILTSRSFLIAVIANELSQRLSGIIHDFLQHATHLRSRIANSTLELVTEIKTLLQDNKIQKLLGVNKDQERDELHTALRELRADEACRWIIADANYLTWYDNPSSEQLVLLGDRGCGKTILTTYLVDHLIHLNKHQLPRPLICFHYCKRDETGKVEYVYCSLILQLLDQQEGLKVKFDKWYESTKKSGERISPLRSYEQLSSFFSACVEELDRPLFIIIDALDECDQQSRVKIAAFLGALSRKTIGLKVLYSSRPSKWVENTLGDVGQIRWKPDQERDEVIVRYTVEKNLEGLDAATQALVIEKLSEWANGSAIWVKLVVKFIQTRKIRSLGRMKVVLAEMPSPTELSQLYAGLFAQVTGDDPDNEAVTTFALEVLAVAHRPLSILELGWVVALSDSVGESHSVEDLQDYVDEKRVLSLVQPFISQVDFKDVRRNQIRLEHHSLKTLILQETPLKWGSLPKIKSVSSNEKQRIASRQCKLESFLLRLCVEYLLLDNLDQRPLFPSEQQTVQDLGQLTTFGLHDEDDNGNAGMALAEEEPLPIFFDPADHGFGEFFVYASRFWVDHFKAVTSPQDVPLSSELVKLCTANSQRLKNWIEQHCRPDCTVTPTFKYDPDTQDPLVVVSTYGSEAVVEKFLEECEIENAEFLPDSVWEAIRQILSADEPYRLRPIFLDARAGPKIRNYDFFNLVMKALAHSRRDPSEWICVLDLVSEIFEDLVKSRWGNEFLCLAAGHGCLPIVESLFGEARQNPHMKSELLRDVQRGSWAQSHHQSIGEAVWQGRVEVLRYMLRQDGIDGHLRHRNAQGDNVFHKAARLCNPDIMGLLISHFSEGVNQSSNSGDTPLHMVVFESHSTPGRVECAKILLAEGGADVRAGAQGQSSSWDEPLRMAARYGDVDMCRVLVEVGGADPRSVLKFDSAGKSSLIDPVDPGTSDGPVLEALCSWGGGFQSP